MIHKPFTHEWRRKIAVFEVDEGAANHAFSHTCAPRPTQEQRHRDQLERRDLQRMRCRQLQLHGQSNQSLLRSARIVQVADHPVPGFNDQWLVCQARHQGQQGSILSEDSIARRYRNQFTAIPWSTVFRPPLDQARPRIPGFQPARVCGLAGQQATQDDQGRLQVSLWPDTDVDPEAATGLWLPVALAMSPTPAQPIQLSPTHCHWPAATAGSVFSTATLTVRCSAPAVGSAAARQRCAPTPATVTPACCSTG